MREECWPDLESAEAEKINAIQAMTGSQYLTKDLSRGTPDENKLVGDVAMKLDSDPGRTALQNPLARWPAYRVHHHSCNS